ncbi:MAG: 30S ribosomal protein S6 [Patescibacteria group bacterium]|nr:30S ribosomal protein S6 [Patescibacteria group bacterium]
MSTYELLFILKPDFAESELEGVLEQIRDVVEKSRGEVIEEDSWGKRSLAYNIKGFQEGYYFVWQISVPETDVAYLKKTLGMNDDLIRFMLVK